MKYFYQKIKSPVGPLHLMANEDSLLSVTLDVNWKSAKKTAPKDYQEKSNPILSETKKQLAQYFAQKRSEFELPLQLQGTDFQVQTWSILQKIPYGKTISYSEQAKLIRKPKAVRAIGRTNGQNPICIILPCHRVIGKSGKLTGYTGGLHVKEFLLSLEQNQTAGLN